MAQRKQSFRFRIPWLSAAPAARPAAEPWPRRSKDRTKSPTQPDTHVPIHRPPPYPFPPPPTQQTQEAPRAEPQQQSPPPPPQPETSSVTIEFPVTSQPEQSSPSTSPTEFHSPLPSPSPSPASSPAPVASLSQRLDSGHPMEEPKPAAEESTALPTASSASEQEKEKKVASEPMPQESASTESSTSHLDSGHAMEVPKPAAEETTALPEASSGSEQEKDERVVSEPMAQESASPPSHLDSGATEVRKPAAEESTALPAAASASEQEKVVSEPMPQETERSPETEASFQPERVSTQTRPTASESRVSSVPSSRISEAEPTSQPQPSSSYLAPEGTSEVSEPTPEESALPASSASQEEKGNMATSEPASQEPEPKVKSPLKTIPTSPKTSSQPELEKMSTQPAGILKDEERSTTPETKKMELDSHSPTGTESSKAPLETQSSKFQQSEEKEKVVHKPTKTEKAKDTVTGTKAEVHTTASASGTKKIKDPFSWAFKKQHEVRETLERKMMFATSRPSGKDIRVVSSSADPETRNVSPSISPEKPVLVHAPLQKGIKDDISKFVHKLATVHPTEPMDDDTDRAVTVITLSGDNRGATMQIGSESAANKEGSVHIQRSYKTDPEESSETEVTSDAEGNTNSTENVEVGKAYVNSNTQSINNSMMFHGSINERDPGVLMILPQKPPEPIKPGLEIRKAEFTISRAEKLTLQPPVRRRCLRGLFPEPSDSDPDNPDKPRRPGFRFSCGDVKNDEDIGIL